MTENEYKTSTHKNIKVLRPGFGLHPKLYGKMIGLKAKINLEPGDRLTKKDIRYKTLNLYIWFLTLCCENT